MRLDAVDARRVSLLVQHSTRPFTPAMISSAQNSTFSRPPQLDAVYLDQDTAATVRQLQAQARQLISNIRRVNFADPDYRSLLNTGAVLAQQLREFQGMVDGSSFQEGRVNLRNRILVPLGTTGDRNDPMELANLMSSFMMPEQIARDRETLKSLVRTGVTPKELKIQVQKFNSLVESLRDTIGSELSDTGGANDPLASGSSAVAASAPRGGLAQAVVGRTEVGSGTADEQKEYFDVAVRHFESMAGAHQ